MGKRKVDEVWFKPDILREFVKRSGLSQKEIADAAGVSSSSLNGCLTGKISPSLNFIVALADFFCVPVDVLLGRQDEEVVERVLADYAGAFSELRRRDYEATLRSRSVDYTVMVAEGETPWPYNLLDVIGTNTRGLRKNGRKERWGSFLTQDQEDALNYVISITLTEREQQTLLMYFKEGKTLAEIGMEYGLTRERIRQIIAKAVRRMRHPARMKLIEYGLAGYAHMNENRRRKEKLEAEDKALDELEQDLILRRAFLEGVLPTQEVREEERIGKDIYLEDMDLSVRSYNCLKRAKCDTLGDVCQVLKDGRLNKLRNVGRKTMNEVLNKVLVMTGEDYRRLYI